MKNFRYDAATRDHPDDSSTANDIVTGPGSERMSISKFEISALEN